MYARQRGEASSDEEPPGAEIEREDVLAGTRGELWVDGTAAGIERRQTYVSVAADPAEVAADPDGVAVGHERAYRAVCVHAEAADEIAGLEVERGEASARDGLTLRACRRGEVASDVDGVTDRHAREHTPVEAPRTKRRRVYVGNCFGRCQPECASDQSTGCQRDGDPLRPMHAITSV